MYVSIDVVAWIFVAGGLVGLFLGAWGSFAICTYFYYKNSKENENTDKPCPHGHLYWGDCPDCCH